MNETMQDGAGISERQSVVTVDRSSCDSFKKKLSNIPAAWRFELEFKQRAKILSYERRDSNDGVVEEHVCESCSKVLPAFLSFYARANNHTEKELLCPHLRKYLTL